MLTAWRKLVPADTPRAVRVNLAIVLAFALVAVLMLTRTLVSAVRIDDDVDAAINPQLTAIGTDTLHLPVLDETTELVRAIDVAAEPLHPSLANSAKLNGDVAATLHDIRDNTVSIGDSVAGIDGSVTRIRAALTDLDPVVAAIRAQTGDITRDLASVEGITGGLTGSVDAIEHLLGDTADDVARIGERVDRVRTTLRGIDGHVANVDDSALLGLADLLLRRPDLAQVTDILPPRP